MAYNIGDLVIIIADESVRDDGNKYHHIPIGTRCVVRSVMTHSPAARVSSLDGRHTHYVWMKDLRHDIKTNREGKSLLEEEY